MLIPAANVLTPIFPLLVSFTNAQQNTYTGNLTRTGLLRPKITPVPPTSLRLTSSVTVAFFSSQLPACQGVAERAWPCSLGLGLGRRASEWTPVRSH